MKISVIIASLFYFQPEAQADSSLRGCHAIGDWKRVLYKPNKTVRCDYPTKNALVCGISIECGHDSAVHRGEGMRPEQVIQGPISCAGNQDTKTCPSLRACYEDEQVQEYSDKGTIEEYLPDLPRPPKGQRR